MLIIKAKTNQYIKGGTIQFVYTVESNAAKAEDKAKELEAYKLSRGEYYRENEAKEPLYFSQRIYNVGDQLTKTQKGTFQVLNDLESAAAQIETQTNAALAKYNALAQFTGLTKAQLAERLLQSL